MYLVPLLGITHSGNALPQGEVPAIEGILHRLLRIDLEERHQQHRVGPQARPPSEDLLAFQAEGHAGDEEQWELPFDRGRGGG